MFKIFYDSLFKPKNIINHIDNEPKRKFAGYLIFMLLLLIIPTMVLVILGCDYTNEENNLVVENIKVKEISENNPIYDKVIEYRIEDNELVYKDNKVSNNGIMELSIMENIEDANNSISQFVKIDGMMINLNEAKNSIKPLYFVFCLDETYDFQDILEESYVVFLKKNKMDFLLHTNSTNKIIKKDLEYNCGNVNFNITKENKTTFYKGINNFCNFLYEKLDGNYKIYNNVIEYKIEENRLVYTGTNENKLQYVRINSDAVNLVALKNKVKSFYLIFSLKGNYSFEEINEDCYAIVLEEDKMKLISHSQKNDEIIKELKYECGNVNFNYLENDKYVFNNDVYNFCNSIYKHVNKDYVVYTVGFNILAMLVNLVISIGSVLLILGLFFRFMKVPFGKMVKITLLSYAPYVVGIILTIFFDSNIFSYIGEAIALFYTYRTMKNYSLLRLLLK